MSGDEGLSGSLARVTHEVLIKEKGRKREPYTNYWD